MNTLESVRWSKMMFKSIWCSIKPLLNSNVIFLLTKWIFGITKPKRIMATENTQITYLRFFQLSTLIKRERHPLSWVFARGCSNFDLKLMAANTWRRVIPDKTWKHVLSYKHMKIDFTRCSDWKLLKMNGCRTETVIIWPYVDKAKMRLRGGSLFEKL